MVYGDYSRPDPQREIVDAVADGRVDVAVVWGPLAGYYAQRESTPLDVRPVAALASNIPIAVHVRHCDGRPARRHGAARSARRCDQRRGDDMRQILRAYGVPLR